jgi:hypothetical protein
MVGFPGQSLFASSKHSTKYLESLVLSRLLI